MAKFDVRYLNENEHYLWDDFIDKSSNCSIFSKTFWLKSVCEKVDFLVCEENKRIIGGIALPSTRGNLYRMPKLTPQLGVMISIQDEKAKYSSRISKEMDIISTLIDNLPKFNQFDYNFSYDFTNYLPFIWKKFKVHVKYTYVLEDLTDLDKVYSNFQYDIKYAIKKAIKCNITISDKFNIEDFYYINKKTFERQNIEIPYTLEFLRNLDKSLEEKCARKMLFALNEENKIIAGIYLIYDKNSTYYLMGGADPEFRHTEAQTLLIWEGIKFAGSVSKKFDFEGSMVKNIERSFRGFGGTQKLLYNVYKSNFLAEIGMKILKKNKNIIRKIWKV